MFERIRILVTSRQWEAFIVAVIIFNAVILGMMTSRQIMAEIGPVLNALDAIILGIFVIELSLRISVFRLRFFTDPWSLFDLFVVLIALAPVSRGFSVLRALRILRVLRLVSVVPSLRRVVGGLIAALPGMASVVFLMALIFYVFSVMATSLFGDSFPDWFGTIGESAYSLFQIMTLESWSMGIVRPVMEVYPNSWLFFVPFIMITAFAVLNLFIGIIVSGMQQDVEAEAAASRDAMMEEQSSMHDDIKALRREVKALSAAIAARADKG